MNVKLMVAVLALAGAWTDCGAVELKENARVAFLGDSITQNGWNNADGYVRLVELAFKTLDVKATVIPAGVSGNKSPDMLKRLDRDVLSKKPDVVLFSCGVNDVWHGLIPSLKGVSKEDYVKNCGEILDRIRKSGATPVVLTPTMIGEEPNAAANVKLAEYIAALAEAAKARGVEVVDLNAAMRAALKTTAPNRAGMRLTFDGVHMNFTGDCMMAREILRGLGLAGRDDAAVEKAWNDCHLKTASVSHLAWNGCAIDFDTATGLPKNAELPKLPFDVALARAGGITRLGGRTLMSRVTSGDWTCDVRGTISPLAEVTWQYDFTFQGRERKELAKTIVVPATPSPTLDAIRKAGLKLVAVDDLWGFRRFRIDFEGWDGWVIEPKVGTAKPGNQWVWCMKWPGAFAGESGQCAALSRGYHYVYLNNKLWMSEKGTEAAKRWRDLLVDKVGLAKKTYLIGMSWGGFFSTRYAATYPQDVAKVYLDNPLMGFHTLPVYTWGGVTEAWGITKDDGHDWRNDPRMPVNLAVPIASAKIPVLLLYGDKDTTCPPPENGLLFLERFKAAGGQATVFCREGANHHPHGYLAKDGGGNRVIDWFEE